MGQISRWTEKANPPWLDPLATRIPGTVPQGKSTKEGDVDHADITIESTTKPTFPYKTEGIHSNVCVISQLHQPLLLKAWTLLILMNRLKNGKLPLDLND